LASRWTTPWKSPNRQRSDRPAVSTARLSKQALAIGRRSLPRSFIEWAWATTFRSGWACRHPPERLLPSSIFCSHYRPAAEVLPVKGNEWSRLTRVVQIPVANVRSSQKQSAGSADGGQVHTQASISLASNELHATARIIISAAASDRTEVVVLILPQHQLL